APRRASVQVRFAASPLDTKRADTVLRGRPPTRRAPCAHWARTEDHEDLQAGQSVQRGAHGHGCGGPWSKAVTVPRVERAAVAAHFLESGATPTVPQRPATREAYQRRRPESATKPAAPHRRRPSRQSAKAEGRARAQAFSA